MVELICQRLVWLVLILTGATLITFLLLYVIPGDPILNFIGERAAPEQVAELREAWGLDQPILSQYLNYLKRLVNRDLGVSYRTQLPVLPILLNKLNNTLKLTVTSMIIAITLGLGCALIASFNRGKLIARIILAGSLLIVSVPVYIWTIFVLWSYVFLATWWPSLKGGVSQLWLPALSLGVRYATTITRLTYLEIVGILDLDFIRTAYAKGLSKIEVFLKHAFPNGMIPIITVLGLDFANYLNGALLTETIFAWPGIGRHTYLALVQRDLPVIQGVVLSSCVIFVLINLFVDLLYIFVDPRIRYE